MIANPAAGGGRGARVVPNILKMLAQTGIACDVIWSEWPGHAQTMMQTVDVSHYQGILSAGGDGSNYHLLNGLLKHYPGASLPPLGMIPVGSGNSFALDLGIRSVSDALEAVRSRRVRDVDVLSYTGETGRHYFINLAGIGFVADVGETASRLKRLGDMSYVAGVLYRTLTLGFHDMELDIDGVVYSGKNCFVEFCNSRYTGGAMMMAPEARIDDGWFDVVIASPLTRLSLIRTFPKLFKGTHGENPAVRFVRGKKAVLKTWPEKQLLPDGELTGATPITVEIHPKAVRYFCRENFLL